MNKALFIAWSPPSHTRRSELMARKLGISLRRVHVLKMKRYLAPLRYAIQAPLTLVTLFRERPRVVFVQNPPIFAPLFVWIYCVLSKSGMIIDSHTDALQCHRLWRWSLPLHRFLSRQALTTIVTNEHLGQIVAGWGAKSQIISDVPSELPAGKPYPVEHRFNVAMVSSFSPDEPLDEVVQVAESLPDVGFYVTGDPERSLRQLPADLPPNLHLTGLLPDDEYYGLLRSVHAVMALTTEDHTMQRGACEAVWLGQPIITSHWPLLRQSFHKGTIHVDNTVEGIRAGVLQMHARHPQLAEEVLLLQEERRQHWEEITTQLEVLIFQARACIVRQNHYPHDLLVRREAEALKEAGFDVDVLCISSLQKPRKEIIDGIHVYRLPPQRKKQGVARYLFEYFGFFFLAAIKLTFLHLQRPYALIQVNTMPDFLVFATLVPRLLGAKVTLQMYEPMPELWATKFRFLPLIRLLEVIQQFSLRYAHAVFAVTQQLKDNLVARGGDPDKITVVLNVPDPRFFETQATATSSSPDGYFTLICHGAIEERYGHDTMLEAIHSLRSTIPNIRLRILGKGSYLQEFLAQIEALDLQDHVQYLGYVPLSQLVEELRSADIGIVAQKSSPYSHLVHTGKMYDYLHFNKPVIVSRLRALNAYFDEASLCYFTPGDARDLAQAIRYLCEHPEAREMLARSSRRLYQRYRWEQQRIAYIAVSRTLAGLDTIEAPLT